MNLMCRIFRNHYRPEHAIASEGIESACKTLSPLPNRPPFPDETNVEIVAELPDGKFVKGIREHVSGLTFTRETQPPVTLPPESVLHYFPHSTRHLWDKHHGRKPKTD